MKRAAFCYVGLWLGFNLFASVEPLTAATATDPQIQVIEAPQQFGFAEVRRRAEAMAAESFQEEPDTLPEFFRTIGYDQYRDIRFRQDKMIWLSEGLPFVLRCFHRGFLFTRPVHLNLIIDGKSQPIKFSKDLFEYGPTQYTGELPEDFGFAGMQILYPRVQAQRYDEIAAFLGASYFRAVGQNQNYGLSARGLAIGSGNTGEEFPFFREFWIEKPNKDTTTLTVYALLDSPSVTGAYRFLITPGRETRFEVKVNLFLRQAVQKLGIAPLTSMYYHGELSEQFYDDFRPEVHDSDGLLLSLSSGEWLWRPLNNHPQLHINRFADAQLRGFGLMQRDHHFNHYQDLEAMYHRRPSAWVEVLNEWGKGAVELVEIPTEAERNDNIVAFWVPDPPPQAGSELNFEYRLAFGDEYLDQVPGAYTQTTRVGRGGTDSREDKARKFMLDFVGKSLEKLSPETPVEAIISNSAGEVPPATTIVLYNPYTKGRRVFFELLPHDEAKVELRCFLRRGNNVLSETWSYQWFKK
ncbi:glucan biosynthesis protein D [Thioploca ingrica]|uniref:Glucans biosynthesis protein G n=1 Tax=Thioploca ingrica TaxID=40754 RepID=A0A090BW39_9GAMM|nr:glucan biosynthesis protein D [Thioploca ingrica]